MAAAPMSEMILFVGGTLAAMVVAGALGGIALQYESGLRTRSSQLAAELDSHIAVVNDPANVPNGPVHLYVKNTGGRGLDASQFVVLVDGVIQAHTTTVGGVATDIIPPNALADLTLTGYTAGAGDHTAHVVAGTGVSADLRFTV